MVNTPLVMDMMLFVAVVDNKSFTAAAEQFNITKSVVSKRITRLEQRLGVQLLFRSTRKLSLTEAGEEFYQRCTRIKADVEEAESVATATSDKPHGVLHVNCPNSFGYLHLVPAIADFMQRYPDLHVQLYLGLAYDNLIECGIDVALRIGHQPDSTSMARQLTMRRMLVAASPDYLEKQGTPTEPKDLQQHNCLYHMNSPTGKEWHFQHGNENINIPVKGNFAASSSQTIESAAVSGLGIAMLPGYMMTNDIKSGNLVNLLREFCPRNIGIYAVYPQTQHVAPKVRAFIDFLVERFGDKSYWR